MHGCRLCCFFYIALLIVVGSNGHLEDMHINPKFVSPQTLPVNDANRGQETTGAQQKQTTAKMATPKLTSAAVDGSKVRTMDIKMPGIHPPTEDSYLCTSAQMPAETLYITNFEAIASASRAHHVLVFGCSEAYSTEAWECGLVCKPRGSQKVLFAWARNAPPTKMPPNVGFQVGGTSGVNALVVQIHYKLPILPSLPGDYSGVRLTLTSERQKYIAGIILLMRYRLNIPAHTKGVHGDVSCEYKGNAPLYPFSFRVHAHELSSVISAYHYNGNWSLLGKGNPKWPQAFYPMSDTHEINNGDKLFARCMYDSIDRGTDTHIGGNHDDEMCNFYMMYYMDANKSQPHLRCNHDAFPEMSKNIPPDSTIPPPFNPDLEEQAKPKPKGVELAEGWPAVSPEDKLTLGQVGGVGTDSHGNVYIFHRGSRKWDRSSFDKMNKFNQISDGPIKENTIITFNAHGKVINQWGSDFFYMPHGLSIDFQDNIWVTDVALHQVFRFKPGSTQPDIVLGVKLEPGSDEHHFCKPTDIAVLRTGEFYVSDGYCNHRVIKYSKEGKRIKEWGAPTKSVDNDGFPPPNEFDIPHSLSLVESRNWLCVADRENGRIQIFTLDGSFVKQIHPEEFKKRLFAISYSPVTDLIYAVNGPDLYNNDIPVQGFTIHPDTGSLLETWAPHDGFHNPHDLEVSPQGDFIYVGELDPQKVWRMYIRKEVVEEMKAVIRMGTKSVHFSEVTSVRVSKVTPVGVSEVASVRVSEVVTVSLSEVTSGITDFTYTEHFISNSSTNTTARKHKKGMMMHPVSVDGSKSVLDIDGEGNDLGASMVIGALLVIPVVFIFGVTLFLRLRKNAKNQGYTKAVLLEGDDSDEESFLSSQK